MKGMIGNMATIIQVAPDVYPLPSENYGGLEKIVYELTEELVRRGHEVYLYAPQGSISSARLIPYQHAGQWNYTEIAHYVQKTLPANTDIIHDHTHYSLIGKLSLPVPTVCTIHIPVNNPVAYPVYVSKGALERHGENKGFYVHNGLNPEEYEFSKHKDDYLLFLGTLTPEKGVHHALEIAERTGQNLIIAGPSHRQDFFANEIEPKLKRCPHIQYVGTVGGKLKQLLLKYAKCLLFPSQWEAFGLVMLEAMVCGTPVLALANGAVPEVLNGFPELICSSIDDMFNKLKTVSFPSPEILRQYVMDHFTTSVMTDHYLGIYEKVMAGKEQP